MARWEFSFRSFLWEQVRRDLLPDFPGQLRAETHQRVKVVASGELHQRRDADELGTVVESQLFGPMRPGTCGAALEVSDALGLTADGHDQPGEAGAGGE